MGLLRFFKKAPKKGAQDYGFGEGGYGEPRLFAVTPKHQYHDHHQHHAHGHDLQSSRPQAFQSQIDQPPRTPYSHPHHPQYVHPSPNSQHAQQALFAENPSPQEMPQHGPNAPYFNTSAANYSYPQHNNSDLRELRFWDNRPVNNDERYAQDDEQDESEPQPLRFILALGILIIFAALAWLVFRWSTYSVSTTPPHIQADTHPFKVRPDNPGGLVVPHQDKLVYGRIGSDNHAMDPYAPIERLLPPPEQPIQPPMQPLGQGPSTQFHGGGQPNNESYAYPNGYGPSYQAYPVQQGQMIPPQAQGGYSQQQAPSQDYGPYPPHHQQGYVTPDPGQLQQPYSQQQQMTQQSDGFYPQQSPPMVAPVMMGSGTQPGTQQGMLQEQSQGQPYGQHHSNPNNLSGEEEGFYPDNTQQTIHQGQQAQSQSQSPIPYTYQPKAVQTQRDHQSSPRMIQREAPSPSPPSFSPMPTGFLPGGIPRTNAAPPMVPVFFKVKLGSLETKGAAEKEWERLKNKHKESFKNLNKAIVKEKTNGNTFYVVYGLDVQGEEAARALCKKVGNCSYHKQ